MPAAREDLRKERRVDSVCFILESLGLATDVTIRKATFSRSGVKRASKELPPWERVTKVGHHYHRGGAVGGGH